MTLSADQIEELHGLVDKYHIALVAKSVGTKHLSKKDLKILESHGIKVPKGILMTPEIAFKFGVMASSLDEATRKGLSYEAIKSKLRSASFTLSTREKFTVDFLNRQLTEGIKASAQRAKLDIGRELLKVEGNKVVHSPVVVESVKKVVEEKGQLWDAISEIGKYAHEDGKWTKDIGRIANYVLHEAYNQGSAAGIEKRNPMAKLYFDVYDGACKHCIRLYLTGGVGSEPRIFTIQEIRANGSNVGKKVEDWKATLGPTHPNCRCSVNEVPEGYTWTEESRSFNTPDEKWEPKVKTESSIKISVTKTED